MHGFLLNVVLIGFGLVSASYAPLKGHGSALPRHIRARNSSIESTNNLKERGSTLTGNGVATGYYNMKVNDCMETFQGGIDEAEGELWQTPMCGLNYDGSGKGLGYFNTDEIVALSNKLIGADYSLCGKKIEVTAGSVTKTLVVYDGCAACSDQDIDLSWDMYDTFFGPKSSQPVNNQCGPKSVTWKVLDEVMPGYEEHYDPAKPNMDPNAAAFDEPKPHNGWLGHGCQPNGWWCEGTARWTCNANRVAVESACPAGTTCDLKLPYNGICT